MTDHSHLALGDAGSSPPAASPSLSVVLAVREAWPAARGCIDVPACDVAEVGGELIVACGDARACPPDAAARYPGVVWLLEATVRGKEEEPMALTPAIARHCAPRIPTRGA